jgi:serine/threonine protein kinase
MNVPPLPAGTALTPRGQGRGHYQVVDLVAAQSGEDPEDRGRGTFGFVYLARRHPDRQLVAIKELAPDYLATRSIDGVTIIPFEGGADTFSQLRGHFFEEFANAAAVRDPHAVAVLDVWSENGTVYLAMEHIEGARCVDRSPAGDPVRYPWPLAAHVLLPILQALRAAHASGTCHFDIKPNNVLIDRAGRVVVIDFGAARSLEQLRRARGRLFCSPGYGPRELERRDFLHYAGPWSDLYSWGMLALDVTIGHPTEDGLPLPASERMVLASGYPSTVDPYTGTGARLLSAGFPSAWAIAIERCIHPLPQRRFASVDQVWSHLGISVVEHAESARRPYRWPPAPFDDVGLWRHFVAPPPEVEEEELPEAAEPTPASLSSPASREARALGERAEEFRLAASLRRMMRRIRRMGMDGPETDLGARPARTQRGS